MALIAPLAVIIVALLAVLLFYSLRQLIETIVQILPNWNIKGVGSLRGGVVSAFDSVENYVRSHFAQALSGLTNFITAPVHVLTQLYDAILSWGQSAYNAINYALHYAIPHAISSFASYVNGLINEAKAYALSQVQHIYNVLHAEIDGALKVALAAADAAEAYALGQVQHLYNVLHAEVDGALKVALAATADIRNYANGIVASAVAVLRADIAAVIATVETTVQRIVGIAITDVEHGVASAVGAVWPVVDGAVTGVIDAAEGGFSDVTGLLKGLDLTKAGTLAGGLAMAFTGIGALTKLAEDCTIPNCKNLSGFGNDLQALLGLVADGALLAFLAEAAKDPSGTAQAVEGTVGTVYRDTFGLFADLIKAA